MAVARALYDTQEAFDAVAAHYDRSNTECAILCTMRRRVLETVSRHVAPVSRLLDLGCGPGSDAVEMAKRGHTVTAIDWSPEMVSEARRLSASVSNCLGSDPLQIDVRHLGIQELDRLTPAMFDGAYSNFGPLNCVPSLREAASLISDRLRPGGVLVASVIGRLCPWEIALYGARGDWTRMRVRFGREAVPVPLGRHTVWTRYYTPNAFTREFETAGFARVALRALGLCAPPPYMQAFADRHPRLVGHLEAMDEAIGGWPIARQLGDHFLIVMRRR